MERTEVVELFKVIKDVYPNFEVSSERVNTWTRLLGDQDADVVIKNAERHAMNQKFPPTIAELREVRIAARSSDFLEKAKEWERNASGLPRS